MTDNHQATLTHITEIARNAAACGFESLSLGDQLAAALVLNRADQLAAIGYTIPEALDRLGPTWVGHLPAAAKLLAKEAMREEAA